MPSPESIVNSLLMVTFLIASLEVGFAFLMRGSKEATPDDG